ncbi:hypothetical protein DSO57_1018152 [Entomophthora muscae]|uniref:Uncharacterized protein n=1 Tax=Entomophthora muscae TaxID=34485 RepID=A0ACC2ST60_9FUNG|nr:hypothetical protein DSO57_1018152 [Entomophthora muscae]
MADCEIKALRARKEKSVEIMARWQDGNKALSHKIASLEAKLLKALSQEVGLVGPGSVTEPWEGTAGAEQICHPSPTCKAAQSYLQKRL